jgi:glucose-6-phosphate isomerase
MAYYQQPQHVTGLPAWQALREHRQQMAAFSMRDAFASNPQRFEQFSLNQCGLLLDYSKNLASEQTLQLLIELAEQSQLPASIQSLFQGEQVNASEGRAALHTALRSPIGRTLKLDGVDLIPQVHRVLNQMTELVGRIHSGLWRGYTDKPITDVVNIGIGGSFLGPELVSEALRPFTQRGVWCHYLANIDGSEFRELTARLNPQTTLFIVSSKSFSTLETLKNALAARDWYLALGGPREELHKHFIAVTSNAPAAIEFGIKAENIFPMWDWVGGRYSLWSAIGLPIALAIGITNFKELLAGAYAMDQHFTQAPLAQNMPVILALLGIWYGNFWGAKSQAILPYDHYLRNFTKHLQQLDMESNGKSVRQDGSSVDFSTGPVIWGGVGCNGQHAYHQLLHQGTELIPADFIVPANSFSPLADHHQWLFANCLSQSQALMHGKTRSEAETELRQQGLSEAEVQRLSPHKVIPGNRPSNMLVLNRVDPLTLGALIALYEHKVFVQSAIWGINAFDQWGVELGKELGKGVYQRLTGELKEPASDASTQGLIDHFRDRHRG